MTPQKKRIQWITTFVLLLGFTYVSIQHVTGNEWNKAYARTIALNPALLNSKHFVVTNPIDTKQRVLSRLVERFTSLANRQQELCNVSPEDFNYLAERYGAQLESVDVGGNEAAVIRLDKSNLSTSEMRDILGTHNVHCRLVDVYSNVVLLLTSHLS